METKELSYDEVEKSLSSDDFAVRSKIARMIKELNFVLTPEQIERGLTDSDDRIRVRFSKFRFYTPTPEQIERGLTDRNSYVRKAFAKRTDYTPTPEQIKRGLEDNCWTVITAFAERTDYTPTPEQVERGLKSLNIFIVRSFASREDFIPTLEQLIRGVEGHHGVFFARQQEWKHKLQVKKLKERHADVLSNVNPQPLEAL